MTRPTTTPPAVPSSLSPDRVHAFVSDLFAEDLHAKRVLSLANGVVGVLHAASPGIHAIGLGLASAMGLDPTHTTKQVDRLLGNVGVDPWELMGSWVPFLVRRRPEVVVALDWTDHDADDHTTCMLSLVTAHGQDGRPGNSRLRSRERVLRTLGVLSPRSDLRQRGYRVGAPTPWSQVTLLP